MAGVEINQNRFFKDDPDYVSKSAMKLLLSLEKTKKHHNDDKCACDSGWNS